MDAADVSLLCGEVEVLTVGGKRRRKRLEPFIIRQHLGGLGREIKQAQLWKAIAVCDQRHLRMIAACSRTKRGVEHAEQPVTG